MLNMNNYSFFHSSFWAKTLIDTYRFTPYYFFLGNGKIPSAAIACMEVNSVLTGKRGVCLPFSDYCPPLYTDVNNLQTLFHFVFQRGKRRGWKYLEWRGGSPIMGGQVPFKTYLGHRLFLNQSEDKLSGSFRDSTIRNTKKAVRLGVIVRILYSREAMDAFYDLNCITRRRHGMPPQPKSFFRNVYDHIIAQRSGCVVLAFYKDKPIVANVYFHFGKTVTYKYGASDKRFHYLRANNLVMYEAIKWYANQGFKTLDLGRTDLENKGLLQFKRGWRGTEHKIHYYRYNIKEERYEKSDTPSNNHYSVLNILPLPVLKIVGKMLYRHMG